MAESKDKGKVTTSHICGRKRKRDGDRLVAITAYDYTVAKLVDELVDIVLVGDSLGMVIQGYDTTTSCLSRLVLSTFD